MTIFIITGFLIIILSKKLFAISDVVEPTINFNLLRFKNELALSESSNDYHAIAHSKTGNPIAFGKYQFTVDTIKDVAEKLNIKSPQITEFLNNHVLQETFADKHILDLKNEIKNKFSGYLGIPVISKKTKLKTNINIYGLIAGAWLGGIGGLNKFLRYGQDASDGNTFISDYVAKFSKIFNV